MALNKISKPESLAKTALKALKKSILRKELVSGVVYNERSLAADLGISRTPVREALVELASKRLVKFLPQRGVVVNTFSQKDVENAFEIRIALEVLAIKKICKDPQPPDTSLLQRYFADQKKAARLNDVFDFMDADRKFHIGFIRLTNNDYLIDMMEEIRDIMHLMGSNALKVKDRMQEVVKEHESILKAVKKRNVENAVKQIERHLENSRDAVNQCLF